MKSTKEQVRDWMHERAKEPKPLPDAKQLRRELGMDLIELVRKDQAGRR